jgi:hypothetical protein
MTCLIWIPGASCLPHTMASVHSLGKGRAHADFDCLAFKLSERYRFTGFLVLFSESTQAGWAYSWPWDIIWRCLSHFIFPSCWQDPWFLSYPGDLGRIFDFCDFLCKSGMLRPCLLKSGQGSPRGSVQWPLQSHLAYSDPQWLQTVPTLNLLCNYIDFS